MKREVWMRVLVRRRPSQSIFFKKSYIFIEYPKYVWYNINDNLESRIMNVKLGNLKSSVLSLGSIVCRPGPEDGGQFARKKR